MPWIIRLGLAEMPIVIVLGIVCVLGISVGTLTALFRYIVCRLSRRRWKGQRGAEIEANITRTVDALAANAAPGVLYDRLLEAVSSTINQTVGAPLISEEIIIALDALCFVQADILRQIPDQTTAIRIAMMLHARLTALIS